MHTAVYLVHILALLALHATLSSGMRVTIPGRCPDVCSTKIESVFFGCIREVRNGCALRLCASPMGAAQCTLKSGVPDVIFTGEQVTLRGFRVSRTMTTRIGIRGIFPKTDVYFLVDGTGSMGAAIAAFRRSFLRLTRTLAETGDFAYGLGVFRDETELNMGFSNLQRISTNASLVRESVMALRSRGGEDTEEANLVALYKIATGDFVRWREGAGRVVLLFGDAVGHEPTCFDDVVLNRRTVARALNDAGITVQVVGTAFSSLDDATSEFGCGGSGTAERGQSTFIASRTGGSLTNLDGDNDEEVLNVFSEVLSNTNTVIDVADMNCEDGFRVAFDPPLPGPVRSGAKIKASFRLRRRICKARSFECSVSFKSGDSISDPLGIRVVDPAGCPS